MWKKTFCRTTLSLFKLIGHTDWLISELDCNKTEDASIYGKKKHIIIIINAIIELTSSSYCSFNFLYEEWVHNFPVAAL